MKTLATVLLAIASLPVLAQTPKDHASPSLNPAQLNPAQLSEKLGTVDFPVSCAATTQPYFNRGVALLHDFWYEEAGNQFREIAKADPACAMGHWGIAMSAFHQIWDRPNAETMLQGWKELQTAQSLAAAAPAPSPRESAYIAALASFYQPSTALYPARIAAYSTAMAALYAQYPTDVDAGAFYALSLLAAKSPDDLTYAPEEKAMTVLEPLFAKYPDNPGVDHYIIHACDNPPMAARGLAASDHYGSIAASGAHAFHMPGHIYSRLGLWPQDIVSQLGSIQASEDAEFRNEHGIMDEPHSYDFLVYAYLQRGQDIRAKAALERSTVALKKLASMPGMAGGHMDGMIPYFTTKLRAFYPLEMRDWKTAESLEAAPDSPPQVLALLYWVRAIGAGRLHHPEQVRADLVQYDQEIAEIKRGKHAYLAEGPSFLILRNEMEAWAAYAAVGEKAAKQEQAIRAMRSAADLQDKVGQGEVDIPAREMLADMLLDFGQPQAALAEYAIALKLSPNRLNALYNAGRAAEASGDKAQARLYYAALLKSTNYGHDSVRSEFAHASSVVVPAEPAGN